MSILQNKMFEILLFSVILLFLYYLQKFKNIKMQDSCQFYRNMKIQIHISPFTSKAI
jgi:hypothetical protein